MTNEDKAMSQAKEPPIKPVDSGDNPQQPAPPIDPITDEEIIALLIALEYR